MPLRAVWRSSGCSSGSFALECRLDLWQKPPHLRNCSLESAKEETAMDLLVNVDVPDLAAAVDFYTKAFGLTVTRRFGQDGAELSGFPARLYLLQKPAGSIGAAANPRRYDRHWTPVHLDVVVDDVEAALARAVAAGAQAETEIRTASWGRIAVLADPFGHGFCLIQFLGRGYDEIAERVPPA
jgi:predicted enzyme related to lactoylglutathione lyase